MGQETTLAGAGAAAHEKAAELREQGTTQLREQWDQRSNEAGRQVRSLAESLRRGSDDLHTGGNANGGRLAGEAAERIDRFGAYLEQKGGDELMHDVESFARRRPWLLAGVGMLAGVAAARFVKASAERRYEGAGQWPSERRLPVAGEGPYVGVG